MVRGEENGGRLVYMYEPRSTFVSISCCHIHVCSNLLLICIIIGTIPSLQGVLIVPLASGLLTLIMMFYWKNNLCMPSCEWLSTSTNMTSFLVYSLLKVFLTLWRLYCWTVHLFLKRTYWDSCIWKWEKIVANI